MEIIRIIGIASDHLLFDSFTKQIIYVFEYVLIKENISNEERNRI